MTSPMRSLMISAGVVLFALWAPPVTTPAFAEDREVDIERHYEEEERSESEVHGRRQPPAIEREGREEVEKEYERSVEEHIEIEEDED